MPVRWYPVSFVSTTGPQELLKRSKEIIAEQTGYTTDMLEDTLDLEADLGIDTVKQVEIFAKAAGHFGFPSARRSQITGS